jgi:hypothetical protein
MGTETMTLIRSVDTLHMPVGNCYLLAGRMVT